MQINGSGVAALYQTMAARQNTSDKTQDGTQAASGTAASSSSEGVSTADFSHMSRNQMQKVAKQMYDSGAISADQMFSVTLMGPIGKAGPNGEFVPFTEAERAAIDNQPMDYQQMVSDAISGIERQGRVSDPTSGYQDYLNLRSAMQQWQGRTSGINITA